MLFRLFIESVAGLRKEIDKVGFCLYPRVIEKPPIGDRAG